ncbi:MULTISPECIES: TetR/AcrR family transcriptional regulator [Microbacterium]|uniref:Helix-turn-helix domain-containing protein n=1 Tax=Microbacterium algihabitans TaxID=3075992 RepID=A0ABU3RSW0_9MICO|nr:MULTISPECIES: TetR/AcrR family transcriptional regulator [Microbacterium]MCD2168613.1 TetR/AcrR family transcriptional regulator [Microbacterium sp. JC 701]MDU0325987.1 helix-turn-helix domain-containing protein [Microbacterium sp. KSW2-21]
MPRSYQSPKRQADAAATRANIIETAARLFVRDGYVATSIKAIAAEAGVSIPTVHLNGPKHALLIAAFERTFAGDEGRHPLTERPELVAIMSEPDTDTAIALYVDFLIEANKRSAAIVRAMLAAADGDPEVRAAYLDLEMRRHRDMTIAAGWFLQRDRIRIDQLALAADVLGLITGPDPWTHFIVARGWDVAAYRSWLTAQLTRLADNLA